MLFYKSIPKKQKIILIIILLVSFLINLFNVLYLPIFYDEAWTFLNFTEKGFLHSISNYPAPNNHILHSVLTNISKYFPFGTTVNLRIPNLLVSLVTSILFYVTFSKLFNKKIALFLLPIFCFLFATLHYAYLSRGYMLVILSFLICFYATIQLTNSNNNQKHFIKYNFYLLLGSVIGFYTMPSFLYSYFTSISFLFIYFVYQRDNQKILKLILFFIFTTLIVLLLYTPIFIVSGLDAVINNRFVESVSRWHVLKLLAPHFNATSGFLFGFKLIYIFPLVIFSLIILVKNKSNASKFVLYCFAIAPVILLIHSIIPFYRTWVYLVVPFMCGLGIVLNFTINHFQISIKKLIPIYLFIVVLLLINFFIQIQHEQEFSFKSTEVANKLINKNAKKVFIFHYIIRTNLVYIFQEKNKKIEVQYTGNQYFENKSMIKDDYFITSQKIKTNTNFQLIQFWNCWEGDIFLYQVK